MKTYVKVTVEYDEEGIITPLSIEWEDGRIYEIDRILDKRRQHKSGRHGYKIHRQNRQNNHLPLF